MFSRIGLCVGFKIFIFFQANGIVGFNALHFFVFLVNLSELIVQCFIAFDRHGLHAKSPCDLNLKNDHIFKCLKLS